MDYGCNQLRVSDYCRPHNLRLWRHKYITDVLLKNEWETSKKGGHNLAWTRHDSFFQVILNMCDIPDSGIVNCKDDNLS